MINRALLARPFDTSLAVLPLKERGGYVFKGDSEGVYEYFIGTPSSIKFNGQQYTLEKSLSENFSNFTKICKILPPVDEKPAGADCSSDALYGDGALNPSQALIYGQAYILIPVPAAE